MMEIIDVARKLVGPIRPVGESNEDERRFANLAKHCQLIEALIEDVEIIAAAASESHEFSVKRAGMQCKKFLALLREE